MSQDPTTLIHELVETAAQDLRTYRTAEHDPNRRAAGQAALRSIDAAARALQEVRTKLANELYQFDRPATPPIQRTVPGNSGPGF